MNLQEILKSQSTETLREINDTIINASLSVESGANAWRAVFKAKKQTAKGGLRKIYAALQKST